MPELVKLYNTTTGKKIKKFADKKTAVKRTSAALSVQKEDGNYVATAQKHADANLARRKAKKTVKAAKAKAVVKTKRIVKAKKTKGNRYAFKEAGYKIHRISKENPRNKPTGEGYKNWEALVKLDPKNRGAAYLDMIDAGIRNVDIRYDLLKGHTELRFEGKAIKLDSSVSL